MDPDVLVLRSFDPLRRLPLTLGCESVKPPLRLANGIIIGRPGAVFLRLWLEAYKTYDGRWNYCSIQVPAK